jgi:hypothetical protein
MLGMVSGWVFELVDGLAFVWCSGLTLGGIYYYYIIYYTTLFCSSLLFPLSSSSLPNIPSLSSIPLLIHSILVGTGIHLIIFQTHLLLFSFLPLLFYFPFLFFSPLPPNPLQIYSPSQPFYTCRYLHILIYILSSPTI